MKEKLALLGGEKSVKRGLAELSEKIVTQSAREKISEMLKRDEISVSPIVGEFENRFSAYIGVKYGLCVVNGTTAIQAGLFAVGVGAGDEVIVPSFTFWATVGPVVANGAVPVFADVDERTHNLTPESIEKCITPKTKAILLVHVWGNPCDMDGIMGVAKKHGLKVVEDCSHAHGATYGGKKVGSIGDVGCFSMQASKVLAAGEGGILVTDKKEYFDRATVLGQYDRCAGLGEDSEYSRYWLTGYGYKHRVNPLAIAIADANLDRLDALNEVRNRNAETFEALLSELPFVRFQKKEKEANRVYAYHYAQYLPEAFGGLKLSTFLKAVAAEGVVCGSCGYGKLHLAPLYVKEGPLGKEFPFTLENFDHCHLAGNLPVTERLSKTAFMAAPRFERATEADIAAYAGAYRKIAEHLDELLEFERREQVADEIKNNGRSINYVKA